MIKTMLKTSEVSEKMMNEIGNKSTEALKRANFINRDKYQVLETWQYQEMKLPR